LSEFQEGAELAGGSHRHDLERGFSVAVEMLICFEKSAPVDSTFGFIGHRIADSLIPSTLEPS